MTAKVHTAAHNIIRRLLMMEHGVRKCARIMLFMERRQLISILRDLPPEILLPIAREMMKLKAEIQDMSKEREAVREQLGQLTAVIDLTPPDPAGLQELGFLHDVSAETLVKLGTLLDPETLAAVICNTPVEVAVQVLSTARGGLSDDLMDDVLRQRTQTAASARRLAASVRAALIEAYEKVKTREGLVGTRIIQRNLTEALGDISPPKPLGERHTQALRALDKAGLGGPGSAGKGATRILTRVSSSASTGRAPGVSGSGAPEPPAKPIASLVSLLRRADRDVVQRSLASLEPETLALAVSGRDEGLIEIVRANLSPRRLAEVEEELLRIVVFDRDQAEAAKRAVAARVEANLPT